MVTRVPSALQLLPKCEGTPVNKPHTLTDDADFTDGEWGIVFIRVLRLIRGP